MKIVIDIPKEFESHFEFDRFADSLARVASDIESFWFKLSGRYEIETITMIRKAFESGKPLPKVHGRLIDADALLSKAKFLYRGYEIALTNTIGDAPTIIEADKGGGE